MKVLVGFEESQVVTKAFRKAGHDAYSCDLVGTRGNPFWHYQVDIIQVLRQSENKFWDLIILHSVCTEMALSGNKHYGKGKPYHHKRVKAVEWNIELWMLAKQKGDSVAFENPKSVIFPVLRKLGADVQYIHPWQFGHMEQKETGLALFNLPRLTEENNVYAEMMKLPKEERERVFRMAPSPTRQRDRSVTYQGIADAFVNQWGKQ